MEIETLTGLKFGIGECGPQQDGCPSDGMSSDATVVCVDSDAEDDAQSQDGFTPGLESRLREKGLQAGPEPLASFKPAVHGHEASTGAGNAALAKLFQKLPGSGGLMESVSSEATGKFSWGREQEMAELAAAAVAAAAQRGALGGKQGYEVPYEAGLYLLQDDRWKEEQGKTAQRKKKGNKNKKSANPFRTPDDRWKSEKGDDSPKSLLPTIQANQQPAQQKGRRRGRRGGRGRKQADADAAEEVPKLEQNLEEELAQQLANQASNDSALSMGFSSIRLHVPGGNTMIILNDHELKDGTTPEDILNRIENSQPTKEEIEERNSHTICAKVAAGGNDAADAVIKNTTEAAVVGPHHQKTTSKGCGAFFPASLLKQVLNEQPQTALKQTRRPTHRRTHTDSGDNNSKQELNVSASPFMPFSSFSLNDYRSTAAQAFGSAEKQVLEVPECPSEQAALGQKARTGTGCFIPMYSCDTLARVEDTPKALGHNTRMSLADSLSSIDDVSFSLRRNRLKLIPAEPEKVTEEATELSLDSSDSDSENGDSPAAETPKVRSAVVNNFGAVQGDCARVVVGKISPAEEPDNPHDELMQLLEGDNFTSFTSPLHLEDTLDGLQYEKEARATAEGRVLELELENQELRETIKKIAFLQAELSKMQGVANTLQVLFFMALAKPDSFRLGVVPRGMFRQVPQFEASELAAVRTKLATQSAELLDMQKELQKKNAELKALSECWLSGNGGVKKSVTGASAKTASAKKESSNDVVSRLASRRPRSVSTTDLKLAPTRPGHSRTVSTGTLTKAATPKGLAGPNLGRKVMSVKSRVTEVTKTTTTTKLMAMTEETTEETTTTKERRSVKKVTVPLPVLDKKREAPKRRWC